MTRTPRNGVGSNQYARKGASTAADRRRRTAVITEPDVDSEAVAWAFHPQRSEWTAKGFGSWKRAQPWITAGFNPADAAEWRTAQFSPEQARYWTDRMSQWPPMPGNGLRRGAHDMVIAAGWYRRDGLTAEDVAPWDDLMPSIPSTAIVWGRDHGFTPEGLRRWFDALGVGNEPVSFDWPGRRFERLQELIARCTVSPRRTR